MSANCISRLDRQKLSNLLLSSAVFLILFFLGQLKADAQLTILHNFGDGIVPNDGTYPSGGLIQAPDGNFYGTSRWRVSDHRGTIFRMTPAGTLSIVYVFTNGHSAAGPLLDYKGKLIGIKGGNGNPAALFALTESANHSWSNSTWYVFSAPQPAPSVPIPPIILGSNGDLYGTTNGGGKAGDGTIYKVDPKTHVLSVVYSFTGPAPNLLPGTALLEAKDGSFYGGASAGLPGGEIFKMTPTGKVSTFYTFSGDATATAALIQGTDGNLYGAAGTGSGLNYVFQLTPNGSFSILHTFANGSGASGALVQAPNGNLYGLGFGGTAGVGLVYELSTDGSSYNVLHNFGDGSIQNDGQAPSGSLFVGADSNLYGVTTLGGSAGFGTAFRISP